MPYGNPPKVEGLPQCPGLSLGHGGCEFTLADITKLTRGPLLRTNGGGEHKRHGTPHSPGLFGSPSVQCRHMQHTSHGCLTGPNIYSPEPHGIKLRCRVLDGAQPDTLMGNTDGGNTSSLPWRTLHSPEPHIRHRSPGHPRPKNHKLR